LHLDDAVLGPVQLIVEPDADGTFWHCRFCEMRLARGNSAAALTDTPMATVIKGTVRLKITPW
jgi:hypothetical protein